MGNLRLQLVDALDCKLASLGDARRQAVQFVLDEAQQGWVQRKDATAQTLAHGIGLVARKDDLLHSVLHAGQQLVRSKASVMARAANGSKAPSSTRKPPRDETDHPVGTPSARGASETGASFQDHVRMAALPAPSCGLASAPSTTLPLKTNMVEEYAGSLIIHAKSPSMPLPSNGTPRTTSDDIRRNSEKAKAKKIPAFQKKKGRE